MTSEDQNSEDKIYTSAKKQINAIKVIGSRITLMNAIEM